VTRKASYLRRFYELAFAVYSSLLFVWFEEVRGHGWSTRNRYFYFWHPHAVALRPIDIWLFYIELFFIPSILVFLILLMLRRLRFSRALLRNFGGALAVAGFPTACLYRANPRLVFLYVELAIAAVYFMVWAARRRPVSTPLNLLLLILHYALWGFFGGGRGLMSWRWSWGIWDYAWVVYPVIGFFFTLLWAAYLRQSTSKPNGRFCNEQLTA
jgi:hypothetical protein